MRKKKCMNNWIWLYFSKNWNWREQENYFLHFLINYYYHYHYCNCFISILMSYTIVVTIKALSWSQNVIFSIVLVTLDINTNKKFDMTYYYYFYTTYFCILSNILHKWWVSKFSIKLSRYSFMIHLRNWKKFLNIYYDLQQKCK